MATFENIFEHTFAVIGALDRGLFSKQNRGIWYLTLNNHLSCPVPCVRMDACSKLSRFIIARLCPNLAPAVLLFVSNHNSKDQETYAHNLVLISLEGSSSETWSISNTIFLTLGLESVGAVSATTGIGVKLILRPRIAKPSLVQYCLKNNSQSDYLYIIFFPVQRRITCCCLDLLLLRTIKRHSAPGAEHSLMDRLIHSSKHDVGPCEAAFLLSVGFIHCTCRRRVEMTGFTLRPAVVGR